jgi:hypothetical protein
MATDYLGFTIRQTDSNTYVVSQKGQDYFSCNSERKAKRWIFNFKKTLNKSTTLKQVAEDIVLYMPANSSEEETPNIIAIVNPNMEEAEKYIKIAIKPNGHPDITYKNLNTNEVLGLMRRADYIITNNVLRNGML